MQVGGSYFYYLFKLQSTRLQEICTLTGNSVKYNTHTTCNGAQHQRFGAAEVVNFRAQQHGRPQQHGCPFNALKTWSYSGHKLPFTGSVTSLKQ